MAMRKMSCSATQTIGSGCPFNPIAEFEIAEPPAGTLPEAL